MRAVWACRPRENLTVTIPGSAASTSPTPTSSRPSAMTASSTTRRDVSRSLVVAIDGYLPELCVVVRGCKKAADVDAQLAWVIRRPQYGIAAGELPGSLILYCSCT